MPSRHIIVPLFALALCYVSALMQSVAAQSRGGGRTQLLAPPVDYAVRVHPDGGTVTNPPNTTGLTRRFQVVNIGLLSDEYILSCASTGLAGCTSVSPGLLSLAPGAADSVTVFYNTGNPGTGKVRLRAYSDAGGIQDTGSYNVTVQVPNGAPIASLAPYSPTTRDAGNCAATCFDNVWSHSTPAYVSLGTPRSFTVAYHASTARPTPVIPLDITPPASGAVPTHYQVELRRTSDNLLLTLANGATSVYYTASSQPVRAAVAVDTRAAGIWLNDPKVTVVVTAYFATGSPTSTTLTTQMPWWDLTQSNAFGAGVWPAGIQRYYGTTAGPMVVEGDGSIFLYAGFTTPAGTTASLSGSRRIYLDGSYVEFDGSTGLMSRAVDRFGTTTRLYWTGVQLDSIVDPMGKKLTITYDAAGYTVRDPAARETRYTVTGGRLVSIRDPDNVTTTLSYDAQDRLTAVTGRNGATWNFAYDALSRLDSVIAPSIDLFTGGTGRPTTTFKAAERIIWQPALAGTSPATAKAGIGADTVRASVTDPLGAVTRYKIGKFGMGPIAVTDALGQTTTIARDAKGRPVTVTEPNSHQVFYTWADGHSPNQTNPYWLFQIRDGTTNRQITYLYNANNDVNEILGDITTQKFVYYTGGAGGPAGSLKGVRVGLDTTLVVKYTRDNLGRVTRAENPKGDATTYTYDPVWGNVATVTDPRGTTVRTHYDALGRADSTYAPHHTVSGVAYGSMNQVTATRDPLNRLVQTSYNADLTISRIVDPKGQVYKFAYNALGALTKRHDLGDTTKYEAVAYDAVGNLRTYVNRRGQQVNLNYDAMGRLLVRGGTGVANESFRYDPQGRWMVAETGLTYDSLQFDLVGRLVGDFQRWGGMEHRWRYGYDVQDRLQTRDLYRPWSATTAASYGSKLLSRNPFGAVSSIYEAGVRHGFGYDTLTRLPVRDTISVGTSPHWWLGRAYDEDGLAVRDTSNRSNVRAQFGALMTYDSLGRVAQYGSGSGIFNAVVKYAYDAAGQLINACKQGAFSCTTEYGSSSTPYQYDAAGNRTDLSATPTIGPGNRTQQFKGYTLTYDADGNMIGKVGNGLNRTYEWDSRNRLTKIYDGGVLVSEFAYDALGRRIRRQKNSAGAIEFHLYDGEQVVADIDGFGNVAAEYGWSGPDQLVSLKTPSWTGAAFTDLKLGATVRGIVNAGDTSVIKKYPVLEPWGEAASDTGQAVRIRMGGAQYDQETGLYYMRARYYDPQLGRFLSEDPIHVGGGLNLYAYAGNDPINGVDPWGLAEQCRLPDGTWGVKDDKGKCAPVSLPESTTYANSNPPDDVITIVPGGRTRDPSSLYGYAKGAAAAVEFPANGGRCVNATMAFHVNFAVDAVTVIPLVQGTSLLVQGLRGIAAGSIRSLGATALRSSVRGGISALPSGAAAAAEAGAYLESAGWRQVGQGAVMATGAEALSTGQTVIKSMDDLVPFSGTFAAAAALHACK